MNKQQIIEYVASRVPQLPEALKFKIISEELETKFGVKLDRNAIRNRYNRYTEANGLNRPVVPIEQQIAEDKTRLVTKDDAVKKKYEAVLEDNIRLQNERDAVLALKDGAQSHVIVAEAEPHQSESTAVAIWSDWHLEERVESDTVNGLNDFSLDIAKERTERLFKKTVRFIRMYKQDTRIDNLLLCLLGDFISNDIHEELVETAQLQPIDAILFAQEQIISGIQYILDNTDVKIKAVCHSGNHARTTKKRHISTEAGHSLEYLMYHSIRDYFRNEERIEFTIPRSALSYVDIYGYIIRLHHGDNIKYGGGIGGLFIGAYKAISQWNKARPAYLDCFGHWHQTKDGDNFYCNGSLIGYAPYAMSIKADFEKPRQNFFLINRDLGRTINSPIYV